MKLFDRTRRESADRCLRKRWWNFEFQGRGIQRVLYDLALFYGIAAHEGMRELYQSRDVEGAVLLALTQFEGGARADSLAPPALETTPLEAQIEELKALLEAQLRAYAAVKLPKVLAEYKVLECEREYTYTFPNDPEWGFMTRPDVLLERLSDGELFLRDFKFNKEAGDFWRQSMRFDSLTLSQILGVEQALNRKVGGVIVEAIIKGSRKEYPLGSGCKQQQTPLIYGWRHPHTGDWQQRYEYSCEAEHWTNGKKPVLCPGGKTHRLSGYYKAAVWREFEGGVKGWVDRLVNEDVALVEQQFVELPPTLRSEWEIEEWLESSLAAERDIAISAQVVNEMLMNGEDVTKELRWWFRKNTTNGNCLFCSYSQLCWGNGDPQDTSQFVERVPHHAPEIEA